MQITILLTITGCNINATYIDREDDKKVAEKCINIFYTNLKNNNLKYITSFFTDQFKKKTNEIEFNNFINNINTQIGILQMTTLDHWHTKIVVGTNSYSDYWFYYYNIYEKGGTKETIHLIKENDTIKIDAYNIDISNNSKSIQIE